ncbi:hypothetical protein KC19_VG003700 [Ceratodon purpureus]|uniref:Uncharacterized protein n=1 Tax=Ceratodon purpureus TaxID=3225 RepID=A0A8T0HKM7_CERPU|nr:hypothetical protein KC19_VG003700 [Ceratodon purpureus]
MKILLILMQVLRIHDYWSTLTRKIKTRRFYWVCRKASWMAGGTVGRGGHVPHTTDISSFP